MKPEVAMKNKADGWVESDPEAIRGDVDRLGFHGAVTYNIGLADTNADEKYHGIPRSEMVRAIRELIDRR